MYVYKRLHSEAKRQCLFTSVKQRLVSNLQKKNNNWNSENIYFVVCGCLLVICDHMLVVCGRLLVVKGYLWSFVGVC